MSFKTPAGFASNGTRRNLTQGALRAQRGNRWGNPCPSCGAKRYERCFKMHRATITLEGGETETVTFIYNKDTKCSKRVTWYPSGSDEQEGDDE